MTSELRWYDAAVAMLPVTLYATLGALGFAIGSMGAAVNLAIAAATLPRAVRMALAVLVTSAAFLLWSAMGCEAAIARPRGTMIGTLADAPSHRRLDSEKLSYQATESMQRS
jgi:hypothetical protein